MENQSATDYNKMINNWMSSDVMTLGNHFHGKLDQDMIKEFSLYEAGVDQRVMSYYLDRGNIQIQDINELTHFNISMGLSRQESVPGILTFYPVFEPFFPLITPAKPAESIFLPEKKRSIVAESDQDTTTVGPPIGAQRVPLSYLNYVARSWTFASVSNIDDYLCLMHDGRLQRIERMTFSRKRNPDFFDEFVRCFQDDTNQMYLGFHLGLDLNKEIDRSQATFTPVLELTYIPTVPFPTFNGVEKDFFSRFKASLQGWNDFEPDNDIKKEITANVLKSAKSQVFQIVRQNLNNDLVFLIGDIQCVTENGFLVPVTALYQFAQLCPPWCQPEL